MKPNKKTDWEKVMSKQKPHETKDGWCCACDYDIAVMENKIKEAREEAVEKAKATIRLWRPVFYRKSINSPIIDTYEIQKSRLITEEDLEQLFDDLDYLKK